MQYVAFLRGMNVGSRRITNTDLCQAFADFGFEDAWAFLASGNVAFTSTLRSFDKVARKVEVGLQRALGYDVPTFVRRAADLERIAAHEPFEAKFGPDGGKPQVALLNRTPTAGVRKRVLAQATNDDALAIEGSELYWLPRASVLDTSLDMDAIEKTLGGWTVRTQNTIQRLAKKLG